MSLPVPYWSDGTVTLYHANALELLAEHADQLSADCIVTDPPYGETSLAWDRWPSGWPDLAARAASSMWVFGSLRMFLARRDDLAAWKLSQDVVWQKRTGTNFAADRFRRVHEYAVHWYRGPWRDIYKDPQREPGERRERGRLIHRKLPPAHTGAIGANVYSYGDTRLMRSVIPVPGLRGRALHPTEKPAGILKPLIGYSCPSGGLVLDLFAGSGSTLATARTFGRRAIGIEADERHCEIAARRLSAALPVM